MFLRVFLWFHCLLYIPFAFRLRWKELWKSDFTFQVFGSIIFFYVYATHTFTVIRVSIFLFKKTFLRLRRFIFILFSPIANTLTSISSCFIDFDNLSVSRKKLSAIRCSVPFNRSRANYSGKKSLRKTR